MTETAPPQPDSLPPPEKSRDGLPAPVRFILKFIMWFGLAAAVFWAAMSLILNYYLKDSFGMYITGMVQQPTMVRGGVRLGTDLAKPSIVLTDIDIAKIPQNPQSVSFEVERFEAGLPWQVIEAGKESLLSFFIRIDNIRADGKPYGSYEIPVKTLEGGDFEIRGLKGTLKDAVLEGDFIKAGNSLQAKAIATGLDYGQVVEGASGGSMKVELNLTATNGPDMPAILPFVSGTALLTGGEGRMEGNAVGFWAGNLVKSTLEGRTGTKVNCILADFTITNGVAQPKVFIVDTDEVTIYGQGTIDFTRQYADMVFTPRPKAASTVDLAVPLIISGPFNALTTSPDPAAVAARLGAMMTGLPSSVMQPLPLTPGKNACIAYVRGAGTP